MNHASQAVTNEPSLWKKLFPVRHNADQRHKYDYGHACVYGAPELTGATRLAAEACARMGAGLTTVLAMPRVVDVYRTSLKPHIMVREGVEWSDARVTARLYGPGGLPENCLPDYSSAVPVVLDAGALKDLPQRLLPHFVLTPHEGEFERVFPGLSGSLEARALSAARQCGAHIVLKGPQTIIATPDGRVALNTHASPYLATAGTGDALAGMITGLLAQGTPAFEAACAAVWIHGDCALRFGPGFVASDIEALIPSVISAFLE